MSDSTSSSAAHRHQPAGRPGNHSRIDWKKVEASSTWTKRTGQEWRGPCPVTGDGTDTCWFVRDAKPDPRLGCHKCGDGSGALRGEEFKAHVQALGGWREPARRPAREKWTEVQRWTWTTADGQQRDQIRYRTQDGKTQKRWAVTVPPNTPRPRLLLYTPAGFPDVGPVLVTEGASDADAASKRGLAAVGRASARPSQKSLARLSKGRDYWITPDCDAAGREQGQAWYWAMRAAGLRPRVVDMAALRPEDAKDGWDLRDWLESLPEGTLPAAELGKHLLPEPAASAAPAQEEEREQIEHGISGVVKAIGELKIEMRYNLLNGREEFRCGPKEEWSARVDGWESVVRMSIEEKFEWVTREGMRPALVSRELFGTAVEGLAHGRQENPMLTWLEALPPWDGLPRLDTWLTELWDCGRNPEELLSWACRAPLLAAVQRQVNPGTKHDEIVIFLGEQGLGKSSVLRALTPNPDKWFTDSLNLGSDDKQRIESLLGRVVCEISDMQGLRKLGPGGVENLKAFLSRREDNVRLAYRRNPETFPRQSIVFGSANMHDCLLSDESGVRRFVVVEIGMRRPVSEVVKWVEEHRDMLWAEAWHRRGEPSFLPGELVPLNEQHSGQHQPEDEAGEAMVEAVLAQADGEPFNLPEALDTLLPADSHDKRREFLCRRGLLRLAALLRRHGYEKDRVTLPGGKRAKMWMGGHSAPPAAEEPEPEPEPQDPDASPKCERCGSIFMPNGGRSDLCYGCRD